MALAGPDSVGVAMAGAARRRDRDNVAEASRIVFMLAE
jgi:hypothetical protein